MSHNTLQSARAAGYDERFGFEAHGDFCCIRKNENFLIILIGTIALLIPSVITAVVFSLQNHVSQLLLCASTSILAFMVFGAVGIVLLRLVMYGNEYTYSADEHKMTIWGGERTIDIFYANVICVRYEPIMLLKTYQRGYRITVITKKSNLIYNMIYRRFDATMSPETTPFRILEERSGLLNSTDVDKAVQLRLAHMKAHGIQTEEFAPERPVAPLERNEVVIDEAKIGYVRAEEDFLISKGRFKALHPHEAKLLVYMLLADITSTAVFVFFALTLHNNWLYLINALLCLAFAIAFRIIRVRKYTYNADGREFRITDSNGKTETIYYCDVNNVTYKPLCFLWEKRGYRVDIVTKYRTITYNCLFLSNKKFQKPEELPFHIIQQHIPNNTQKKS